MKSMFLRTFLVLLLFIPQMLWADDGGYFIRHYHVDVTVHENNVYDVTETVDLTFTEQRHGFYRYIPYTFSLPISDSTVEKGYKMFDYVCDIDDVKVLNWDYETEDENDNVVIRIGSASSYVIGDQTYIISYKYVYPEDRVPDFDMIYHTLLPVDCNVPINHFSFKMKFDKQLDENFEDLVEVYYGAYGSDDLAENVTVEFKDNTLVGYADDIVPKHTVTVFAPLSEGYFSGAKSVSPIPCIALFGVSLLLILLLLYYELTMKQKPITKTVEFYPPDGICSAEVGTIIDESVDLVDIASLVPWLAGKGYIDVEEVPKEKGLFGKKETLRLKKKQNLPGDAPDYQKRFMKLIFDDGTETTLSSIGEKPHEFESLKKSLESVFKGDKELVQMSSKFWLLILLGITTTLMLCVSSPVTYFHIPALIFAAIGWVVPLIVGALWVEHGRTLQFMQSKWVKILFMILRLVAMFTVYYIFVRFWVEDSNGMLLSKVPLAVIFGGTFIATELSYKLVTNTKYRAEIMGKLMGLKEFIQTAEKPQLESLQTDDPEYFYKILPYAMVFGLTDKWSKLFAGIEMERPEWYHTSAVYDSSLFTHHLTQNLTSSVTDNIKVISHDSSSSSSSGGGGFSGGGGGGGGCGSW